MDEGLTSLAHRLRMIFDDNPELTPEELEKWRNNPENQLSNAQIVVEPDVITIFKSLNDEKFAKSVQALKDISRFENLSNEERFTLLAKLTPFLEEFLLLEDDPQGRDDPDY